MPAVAIRLRLLSLLCLAVPASLIVLLSLGAASAAAARAPGGPQPPTPAYTPIRYYAQSGDTLPAVAAHFSVRPDEIASPKPLPTDGLLPPGQLLILPPSRSEVPGALHLLPDSEVVYGPPALDFDVEAYLREAGGALGHYQEFLAGSGMTPAPEIIQRVAVSNSINPRLLVALLEYTCNCVLGTPSSLTQDRYLLGVTDYRFDGLYGQLNWAANELSIGYYGWRAGAPGSFTLPGGIIASPSPGENAGTVALERYFASLYSGQIAAAKYAAPGSAPRLRVEAGISADTWRLALDAENGFLALYERMFGDPARRSAQTGDLLPPSLAQPAFILPFEAGQTWSFTGGPHGAWLSEGSLAALDFAPATKYLGCEVKDAWVLAAADGIVARSGPGYLVEDLDGDGLEATGWNLLYLHLHQEALAQPGTRLRLGDPIGHPSCEGGPSTGAHLHLARKYNGEWIAAGGPLPFTLSGWQAHAGPRSYSGTLTLGTRSVTANPYGTAGTLLSRPAGDLLLKTLLPLMTRSSSSSNGP